MRNEAHEFRITESIPLAVKHFTPARNMNPEGDILERCRNGEREAFDALFSRHKVSIFNLAYRLTGAYDDANDLAAEVYLRIFRSMSSLQQNGSFKVWMNRIVVNAYYDQRRESRRRPAVSLNALIDSGLEPTYCFNHTRRPLPLELALSNDSNRILIDAIMLLPEVQRVAIVLFHLDCRNYQEIAAIQQIPIGTVKSRLNRARLSLQESLAPHLTVLL